MSFEPVIIETTNEVVEVEQVHLFSIDDVEYGMPVEVPPSVALEALDMMRDQPPGVVSMWLLEEVLGTEGYDALIGCRDITKPQLDQITNIVNDHVFAQLDSGEGGNGQGPNRAARRSTRRAASSNGSSGGGGSPATKATSTRTSAASTTSARKTRKTA